MKAAVLHGFDDLRVEDLPDPVCGPDDVVIEVRCVQISVTECMLMSGDDVALHESLADRLARGPVQFAGHEFAGVVSEVGSRVPGLRVGQRVTAVETCPCRRCTACLRGRTDACVEPSIIGFTRPGALAERVCVPGTAVVPLPDRVSFSAGAAVQPLAGAIHAHAALEVRPGESVLVLGGGVMGLLAVMVARHGNAGTVMVSTHSPRKRELATAFGADCVVDASTDVRAQAMEITGGIGFDTVVETAGGSSSVGLAETATIELAVDCARRSGRIAVVSVLDAHAQLPTGTLRSKSLQLVHPKSGAGYYAQTTSVFEHALGMVARGDAPVEDLVTHRLSGLDQVHQALEITRDKAPHGAINPAQLEL